MQQQSDRPRRHFLSKTFKLAMLEWVNQLQTSSYYVVSCGIDSSELSPEFRDYMRSAIGSLCAAGRDYEGEVRALLRLCAAYLPFEDMCRTLVDCSSFLGYDSAYAHLESCFGKGHVDPLRRSAYSPDSIKTVSPTPIYPPDPQPVDTSDSEEPVQDPPF